MSLPLADEPWRIGSTTPRLCVPPLAQHADDSAEYGIKPEATWGYDCIDFLEKFLGWKLMPWQRWLYARALEKKSDGTGFRFQTAVVLVARQQGKLVALDEDVLTRDDGFKKMGQLTPGDFVFHPDGHPTKVLAVHEIDETPVSYRITTTDGRSVVACADHQWAVRDTRRKPQHADCPRCGSPYTATDGMGRRSCPCPRTKGTGAASPPEFEWEVLTTQQMLDRGLERNGTPRIRADGSVVNEWAFRLPEQKRIISKPVDLPIDPWLFGAWLGDGNSDSGVITTGDQDVEEISRLIREAGAHVIDSRRVVNSTGGACWTIRFDLIPRGRGDRSMFTAKLKELGLYRNKHIPDAYLTAGTEQRQALLAGLLDTDGCIDAKRGQVEFCSTNRNIADGVLYLARSLGYRATLTEGRAVLKEVDCGPKYRVRFTPGDNPFRLPRRSARVNTNAQGDRSAISICSIEPVESRPMRCITVDSEDGRWLVGKDLIPTHNTAWLRGLGLWRLFLSETGESTPVIPGASLAIIAAQNLSYAEGTLKEVVDDIRDHRLLKRELINHRLVNGAHKAILTNNRVWRAVTASRKGARGLSVDLAVIDELRELTNHDGWNSIAHSTTARPNGQIVCASNAGDARSTVLRTLRDGALRRITVGQTEESRVGLFEWSIPPEADPKDRAYWRMANPSMGLLGSFTIETLEGFLEVEEKDNMAGFITESLALDVETPILTTAGWKTMGSVEVGDEVFSPNGHPVAVMRTTPVRNDRPCFEVETIDGRKVVADADHLWTVEDRRRGGGKRKAFWENISTAELLQRGLTRNRGGGGGFAYRLPRQHGIVSKPVDLPIDPYLLGVWLGNGSATKSEITSSVHDADEMIEHLGVEVMSRRQRDNTAYITFRVAEKWSRDGDGFPALCRGSGIWQKHEKRIPDMYLTAGTEQRLALLQGLCDTDGSIDERGGGVRFAASRRRLAEQALYLARSLGFRATIRASGPSYHVGWTQDASDLPPSRAGERTTISVRSITPVESRPVRCITVDSPDGLFLAGRDLVPTHNCGWVDSLNPGIIPAEHWEQTVDPGSARDLDSDVYAAVDINYDRSRSYIAVAARRPDGNLHVEVVAAAVGTEWIIPWLRQRKDKFGGIAVQETGAPSSALILDMGEAKLPVVAWGPAREVQAACALFYDGIVEHTIYHRPAPILDRAATSGASRNSGDAWIFDRRNSPVDVSPIIACAAAAWLEADRGKKDKDPQCHEWPDDDTISRWEQEARERWGMQQE